MDAYLSGEGVHNFVCLQVLSDKTVCSLAAGRWGILGVHIIL